MPTRFEPLASVVGHTFEELEIGVALWLRETYWQSIHGAESVASFEAEFGVNPRRWGYNHRSFTQALRERRVVRGAHAGFHDLFVPIFGLERADGVVVVGQFAISEPTSEQVQQRWYELTGTPGRLGDPAFARYLTTTLATLTLDRPLLGAFERLAACYGAILSRRGSPEALGTEAARLREQLKTLRTPEQMWRLARSLLDDRGAKSPAPLDHGTMAAVGLARFPEHVLVGLVDRKPDDPDPIDSQIRIAGLQRAIARFAIEQGGVICGQIGDHGVALFVGARASAPRIRTKLSELATRLIGLGRRAGFAVHVGVSPGVSGGALRPRFQDALWAAEKAVSSGAHAVFGDARSEPSAKRLRELRADLGRTTSEPTKLVASRFERYAEAVAARSGHRLEAARAELEVGLERLIEPLLTTGFLDAKSADALFANLEPKAESARTVHELRAAYGEAVAGVEAALEHPTRARHDRGTRRAVEFIRDHLGDELTVESVARVAGFAPDYFARLFKRQEGKPLGRFTQQLRLERAEQLLESTPLSVEQVRKLSGFRTRTHFHRAFRQSFGMTPAEYRDAREAARRSGADPRRSRGN